MPTSNRKLLMLAWVQSFYYTLTGAWPLVHVTSFMWLTGPKVDVWLVRTVAALLVVTGLVLGGAAKRKYISLDLVLIAAGEALVLAAVDVIYALIGRISPIYLLDAVVETALAVLWALWSNRRGTTEAATRSV